MITSAWMSLALCASTHGAAFNDQPESVQLATCADCPVVDQCRAHVLATSTAIKADEAVVAGGLTRHQIASAVRRRDSAAAPSLTALSAFVDQQIELALIAS